MANEKSQSTPRKAQKKAICGRPPVGEAPARLDRIMGIAANHFLENGFEATTVASIARAAGASKETLYARYSTKEDLFRAVISRETELLLKNVTLVLDQDKPIERVLETYGGNLLDFMLLPETQRLNRTLISSAPQFPELAGEFWQLCPELEQKQLQEYLERHVEMGTLVILDPIKAAEFFFSLCLGQFLSHAYMLVREPPNTTERRSHIWIAVQVFLAAYGYQRVLFNQHQGRPNA